MKSSCLEKTANATGQESKAIIDVGNDTRLHPMPTMMYDKAPATFVAVIFERLVGSISRGLNWATL